MLLSSILLTTDTVNDMKTLINEWSARLLTAIIMGLLVTPVIYIILGAILDFPYAFDTVSIPLMLISQGVLIYFYLFSRVKFTFKRLAVEAVCWFSVLIYNFIASGFNFFIAGEKFGAFSCMFLLAVFISWQLFNGYHGELERRVMRIKPALTCAISTSVILISMFGVMIFAFNPVRFI